MSPTLRRARALYAFTEAARDAFNFPRWRSSWRPYRPVDWQRLFWL